MLSVPIWPVVGPERYRDGWLTDQEYRSLVDILDACRQTDEVLEAAKRADVYRDWPATGQT
jgi:hypothetical protein